MPFAGPVTTPLQGPPPLQGPTVKRALVARLSLNETADEITVEADASASIHPERDSVSYQFDWGDGTSTAYQTTATATHTYDNSGTYTVSVTVRDESGLTDTTTRQIDTFRTENREVSLNASGAVSTTRFRTTNSFLSIDATKSLPTAKSNATARSSLDVNADMGLVPVSVATAEGSAILLADLDHVMVQIAQASSQTELRGAFSLSAQNVATLNERLKIEVKAGSLVTSGRATVRPEIVLETDSIISSTSTLVILRRPDLRQVFVPHQKREIIVPDTEDQASAK